jgi:hypothetical protein
MKYSELHYSVQDKIKERLYRRYESMFNEMWIEQTKDFTEYLLNYGFCIQMQEYNSTRLTFTCNGEYFYVKGAVNCAKEQAKIDKKYEDLVKILQNLQGIQKRYFWNLTARFDARNSGQHFTVFKDGDYLNRHYVNAEAIAEWVQDELEDFCNWCFYRIRDMWEYITSEEQLLETAGIEEFNFDEEGNEINE